MTIDLAKQIQLFHHCHYQVHCNSRSNYCSDITTLQQSKLGKHWDQCNQTKINTTPLVPTTTKGAKPKKTKCQEQTSSS